MRKKISSDTGKKSGYVALVMAAILLTAVFTVAISSSVVGQEPPPINITERSSIRVYGEDDIGPSEDCYTGHRSQFIYNHWEDPFDPTVLQKDSLTFSPAIILWDGQESPMSADSENIHEKKYLRMWYEPEHVYTKEYCRPTIEVESTYMLIDRQDLEPISGPENVTYFKFPIVEIPGQLGVGAFENNLSEVEADKANVVRLALVDHRDKSLDEWNKTTNGTIRIEKTYMLDPGDTVQFLDFKLQYRYIVVKDGKHYAKVTMWYAGNYVDDTLTTLVLGQYDDGTAPSPHQTTVFKRHMERYPDFAHDYATKDVRTWYARFENEIMGGGVEITVGKELQAGDTFYVNGVRYDIPAIEVIDGGGPDESDYFKFITLRTPLPKCEDLDPGEFNEVLDDGKISSQWIVCIPPETALPLNPPFNQNSWKMVDDINVVLWEPLKNFDQWPYGDPDGNIGTEYFPLAERYLTMQDPDPNWLIYFRAVPIDTDEDMGMPNDWQIWDGPYNHSTLTSDELKKWIAYDVEERIVDVRKPLQVSYIDETEEPRYSTDLLEILNEYNIGEEDLTENWTKFDIETLPDQYTEFMLPELPDVETPFITKPGDYLLTSSFLAPNSIGASELNRSSVNGIPRVAFAFDQDYEDGVGDGLDLYVNMWGSSSSIRIYGEDDKGPITGYDSRGRAKPYVAYDDVFDPTTLQKDSITFNPLIWEWDGSEYPMSADSENIDVKTFLRLWYEPEHKYSKNLEWDDDRNYTRATIETETTYMLIDKQDKLPFKGPANVTFFIFPIAEDETTDTPGLELLENPNSEADRPNVVTLANVSGTVADSYNKTTEGLIWLQKTYKLDIGDKVQFLDHKLTFVGIVIHDDKYYAKVKVDYAGNRMDDTGTTVVLATFDGGSTYDPDPHRITWFKRHSETYPQSKHYPDYTTWYARLDNYDPEYDWAEITVGKELQFGDTFYVDGVRYDIPAIEVIDTSGNDIADEFKYITIRTPFPKCFTTGVTSVPDDGIISSQWIDCIAPYETIPMLPPFNMNHKLVDDIDVELWEPLKHLDQWPCGDPSGVPGMEWFPLAERYLTMQYPPAAWQYYFRAVPIDTDNDLSPRMPNDWQIWDGPYYPGDDFPPDEWPVGVCTKTMPIPTSGNYTTFDPNHWIALDVNERIIEDSYDPLEVIYVDEFFEPRYSTNLLEILYEKETGTAYPEEYWQKYVIWTLPDQYTEFVLPKDEMHEGERLMNDYLITTSFLANNSLGWSDLIRTPPGIPRVAFVFDAFDSLKKTGIYINELVMAPPDPENKEPVLKIAVGPTSVEALETVTVNTSGTYDDASSYPLKITCDWGDETEEWELIDYGEPTPVFTHSYTKSGTYSVTVTATDYGGHGLSSPPQTVPVTVNSDGAILSFGYGWNAISAPVADTSSMATLFYGKVPGFFGVYSWNNTNQKWQTEDIAQPLDPAKGYFIWATDAATVELTGTAVNFSPGWITGLQWNLVGAGAEGYDMGSEYAYYYNREAGAYIPTHDLEPGKAYFVWV